MNTPATTFEAYDSACYEIQMGRWSRRLAEPFAEFCGVADGESVLDIGCGTGSLTFVLAQRNALRRICGRDLSSVYIEHAIRADRERRIEFQVGDACSLPFADDSFDRSICLLVLQFIRNPARAVAEMRRVTRPGGVLAAAVWDVRGGLVVNRMFHDTAALVIPDGNERRARNYTRSMTRPGELAGLWASAGLAQVEEGMLTIRMDFASFEDYWTPFQGKDGPYGQYMASLERGAREELREKVRLAYLDGEADGARSYAATAWAVRGIAP